jgi:hypothetical protein
MIKSEKMTWARLKIWVSLAKERRDKKEKPLKNNVKPKNELV